MVVGIYGAGDGIKGRKSITRSAIERADINDLIEIGGNGAATIFNGNNLVEAIIGGNKTLNGIIVGGVIMAARQ